MISYPSLRTGARSRQRLEVFKGLNRNLRIGSGEFSHMENLTSDDYPVLSPRGKRGKLSGLFGRKCLGMRYVPGKGLYYICTEGDMSPTSLRLLKDSGESSLVKPYWLNAEPKQLVVMGAFLVVFPDRKWINMTNNDSGDMAQTLEIKTGRLSISLCLADGTILPAGHHSMDPPENPGHGDVWVDSSKTPQQIKRYVAATQEWTTVDTEYICLQGEGMEGHPFQEGDGIHITGLGKDADGGANTFIRQLNGCHTVCMVPSSDAIMIKGIIRSQVSNFCDESHPVLIERRVPQLDIVVECGNRLWGCSRDTNEIYASKLGDFNNWNCFPGLSTDSWVCSVGTPGAFTGAVVQNGYPIFYKENGKHKVWPSANGAHQLTFVPCDGVQKGCESSLAVWEGTVFYRSVSGVCADDGGGPVEIGQCLDLPECESAVGEAFGQKYYLSLKDKTGSQDLYVYDLTRRLWHRQDGAPIDYLAGGRDSLYAGTGREIWDMAGRIGTPEETVSWMAVTGDLGLELPEQKYISRLTLRLLLEPGATLEIFAQYDREQEWVKLGQVYGTELRSFSLPVRPRRCDQLRLKLQGTGMCKIYSITKTLEKGSELA